jgi:hypothetical protein
MRVKDPLFSLSRRLQHPRPEGAGKKMCVPEKKMESGIFFAKPGGKPIQNYNGHNRQTVHSTSQPSRNMLF